MGELLVELTEAGHLIGLTLMLIWVFALWYQRQVLGLNGLTLALICYVGATAFEKSWSVGRICLDSLLSPTASIIPVTAWQFGFWIWRTLSVWSVVAAILYLCYVIYVTKASADERTDH